METELAQELKKAGYLQPDVEDELEYEGSFRSTTDGDVYVPTLSELIEACGEKEEFALLREDKGEWIAWYKNPTTSVRLGEVEGCYEGCGKTPEEAVARLYLAIHNQPVDQQTD